jgi:hypothetical protein
MNRLPLPVLAACFAAGLAACLAACGNDRPAPPPPPPARAVLEHATQADLAHDIADADRLGTWRAVRRRWEGQTVRWTVTRQRMLCTTPDDCNIAAFPIQRPAKQGWMPLLSFAPDQFEALTHLCGDQDPCDLTIEATVRELDISSDLPTRVLLSDVRVVPPSVQTAHN